MARKKNGRDGSKKSNVIPMNKDVAAVVHKPKRKPDPEPEQGQEERDYLSKFDRPVEEQIAHLIADIEKLTVTEGPLAGKPFTVLDWQKDFCRGIIEKDFAALTIGRGNGKALALDTPILTTDGWSTMGAIKVGDRVFGSDGMPTRVTFVSDIQTDRTCYRIDFDCRESIVACEDHLWETTVQTHRPGGGQNNTRSPEPRQAVRSTKAIIRNLHKMDKGNPSPNHRVKIAEPIKPRPGLLPIAPYTFGAWLGDGTSETGAVTIHDSDAEIIEHIRSDGYSVTRHQYPNRTPKWCIKKLVLRLREANVLKNKHIPIQYFMASETDRMELLRGIIDTDGHVMKQGSIEITTSKRRLAKDYVELVRGLGFKCRMPNALESKIDGRVVGEKYRVQFHPGERIVAKLRRKVDALPKRPSRQTSRHHYIKDIAPTKSVPVKCIQVDAPDHLYLAGRNLIPTHNTTFTSAIAVSAMDPDGALFVPRGQVILVASSLQQAKIAFAHIRHFMRDTIQANKADWREIDHSHESRLEHKPTGTLLRCIGSLPGKAHGLAPSIVLADEPAQWDRGSSRKMYAALETSFGKQIISKLLAIGTRPDTDDHWFAELLKGDEFTHVQAYYAEQDDDDFSEETILKANPSLPHMPVLRQKIMVAAKKAKNGGDALAAYRSLRLNKGTSEVADKEMLVSLENWQCVVTEAAEPRGTKVWVGVDLGDGNSMSAVAFYFAETGRLECYGCFPAEPKLEERGKNDFVGDRYVKMKDRGELFLFPGMATNNVAFLKKAFKMLKGREIEFIGADNYKMNDLKQAMTALAMDPEMVTWRRVGTGKEGSEDVRAFRRDVLENYLSVPPQLCLDSAIAEAIIRRDQNQNPALNKSRHKARIDVLQAAIIAVGAGRRWRHPEEVEEEFSLDRFVG